MEISVFWQWQHCLLRVGSPAFAPDSKNTIPMRLTSHPLTCTVLPSMNGFYSLPYNPLLLTPSLLSFKTFLEKRFVRKGSPLFLFICDFCLQLVFIWLAICAKAGLPMCDRGSVTPNRVVTPWEDGGRGLALTKLVKPSMLLLFSPCIVEITLSVSQDS